STTAALAGAVAGPAILGTKSSAASPGDTLKIGLIGCGGRGTGAAAQALNADKDAILFAVGDAFERPIGGALQAIAKETAEEKVKVKAENTFVGIDAYQKVLASGVDVVILATPPGFRPIHLRAAIEAGKHVFCEKPMATDAPGVRSVMESAKLAKSKSLALVAGFCWRYDTPRREFYKRIHDGAIGEIRAIYAPSFAARVKPMPADTERPSGMSDLEWQMRHWYNFTWLSGDGYLEQACHSVDKVAWALKDQPPLSAVAVGGRQTP